MGGGGYFDRPNSEKVPMIPNDRSSKPCDGWLFPESAAKSRWPVEVAITIFKKPASVTT